MTIWDELKAKWQLAGVPIADKSTVNVVDTRTGAKSPVIATDGPGRVDFTAPESSPLYLYSTLPAPWSAGATGDLFLIPGGQMFSVTSALYIPIVSRQWLSILTFHMIGTALATDTVQIDVMRESTSVPTGLTLTVPAGTTSAQPLVSAEVPVLFERGEGLALRLRQSGTVLQASWNAYIVVG